MSLVRVWKSKWAPWMALSVLLMVTGARLADVYGTFPGTFDEPYHVAVGVQWLDQGRYTYEWIHPPIGRVAVGVGPYLAGARSHSLRNPTKEGNAILSEGGAYRRNLTLARLGTLPFLALAAVTVFLWGRRWYDTETGLWAALLLVSVPPVLGHGALATIDMACAGTLALALYWLVRWVEEPGWRNAAWLGAAAGLAFLAKFSNIPFLMVGAGTAIGCRVLRERRGEWRLGPARRLAGVAALAAVLSMTTVWAGYRFSVGLIERNIRVTDGAAQALAGRPEMLRAARVVFATPLPLFNFVGGLAEVYGYGKAGQDTYFLGQYSHTGRWEFFPVILAVKTPPGFLLLSLAGVAAAVAAWRRRAWRQALPLGFAGGVLAVCMAANVNVGVRHVLAIFPMLAILAGHAVRLGRGSERRWVGAVALLLAGSVVVESWRAHPDYLTYFNGLAGARPEEVVAESDLDWGQDLYRLGARLRELGVEKVAVGYFGTAPLEAGGLPAYTILSPTEPARGWVAVSVRMVTLENAKSAAYGWLKAYRPVERIGKSILLYRIGE